MDIFFIYVHLFYIMWTYVWKLYFSVVRILYFGVYIIMEKIFQKIWFSGKNLLPL